MDKYTKIVIVLAVILATAVVSLEGRKMLKAEQEPRYEPQTFPGFPKGPILGSGSDSAYEPGSDSASEPGLGLNIPLLGINFGLTKPTIGSSPYAPGGLEPMYGGNPLLPGEVVQKIDQP